ncbi:MAG: IclR family transcriptional regulator [Pseudomonadota bacterium]
MVSSNQSLQRGLAILELLDESGGPLGVRDIARKMDISPTIVQRLVHALVEAQFAVQDTATQKYAIGYRAVALGRSMLSSDRLVGAALPELRNLAERHHLNGYLSVIAGGELTYVLAEQSAGPIAIKSKPGSKAAFHATAMGKALLAGRPRAEIDVLLGDAPLEPLTDNTVTDRATLFADLARADEQGYALAFGENLEGVNSVAARIRGADASAVAALSIAYAPSLQPSALLPEVVRLVTDAAARVSTALGCPEDALDQIMPFLEPGDVA